MSSNLLCPRPSIWAGGPFSAAHRETQVDRDRRKNKSAGSAAPAAGGARQAQTDPASIHPFGPRPNVYARRASARHDVILSAPFSDEGYAHRVFVLKRENERQLL